MKRMIRKASFWVALILTSFAANLLVAVVTLHHHIRYHDDHQPPNASFLSPFLSGMAAGSTNAADKDPLQIPESVLWRRMLRQGVSEACILERSELYPGRNDTEIVARNGSVNQSQQQLPPFGFRQHLEQFLESSPFTDSKKDAASSLRGTANHDHTISKEMTKNSAQVSIDTHHCYLPSSTSCHEIHYSVVLYSKARNLRRLLLNLMSFQSYPSVNGITLVVRSAEVLQGDAVYGRRILDWRVQGVIQIVFVEESSSSLWESLGQIKPKESAVVWINGDSIKHWTGTGLRTRFRLWRQHPRSLVPTGMGIAIHDVMPPSFPCPQNQLDGTFMHRNWLCFLNHPVMEPLKRYLDQTSDWSAILNGFSILWNQLGEGYILPLPSKEVLSFEVEKNKSTRVQRRGLRRGLLGKQSEITSATILAYFGCACSVSTIGMLDSNNSTCVQEQETHTHLLDIFGQGSTHG